MKMKLVLLPMILASVFCSQAFAEKVPQPSTLVSGEPFVTADCSLGIPGQIFDGELDPKAPTVYNHRKAVTYKTLYVTGSDQFGYIKETLSGEAVNIPVSCVWEKSSTWAAT